MPNFVFVSDGDAFAAVAIAVFLDKVSDELDGVTGVVAAHQGHAFQLFDQEHAILIDQGVGTRESCFAYGQLFLVQTGICSVEVGVGVSHLRNLTGKFHLAVVEGIFGVHGAFVDFVRFYGFHLLFVFLLSFFRYGDFVIGGRFPAHPGAVTPIAGV